MPLWQYIIKILLAFTLCRWGGMLLGELLIVSLLLTQGISLSNPEALSPSTWLLLNFYGSIVFIILTLLYWKKIHKKPLKDMGITKTFGSYFLGALLGILAVTVVLLISVFAGSVQYQGMVLKPDIKILLLFLGGFLIQGAMEETLCRGFVLHGLKEKTSLSVASFFSTLVFILPHWNSLLEGTLLFSVLSILNMVLVSLIWVLLTIRFHSIWAACGFHSLWNYLLFNIYGLNLSSNDSQVPVLLNFQAQGENVLNGGKIGLEASVITTAVLSILLIFLMIDSKNTGHSGPGQISRNP